jgi:adenylate cyclase
VTTCFRIRIYDGSRLLHETAPLDGAVELGRQSGGEDRPYALACNGPGERRLVIAELDEATISRRHLLIETLAGNKVRVTNLRDKSTIRLADSAKLEPHAWRELALPCGLSLGTKTIRIVADSLAGDSEDLESLTSTIEPPGQRAQESTRLSHAVLPAAGIQADAVAQWLYAAMAVLQSACNSTDFLQQAAEAAVEMIGLDSCRVLVLDNEEWKPLAQKAAATGASQVEWRPSRQVLQRVRQERKTFWRRPAKSDLEPASLRGVDAVVAAPILNPQGEVIGALYGERRQEGSAGWSLDISKLDAMLVELLACGIAAGLARVEQEKKVLTARVQFEQFFTPELSRQLAVQPDLLKGQDAEVTILFCDIRGFSGISERMGTARTVAWISDVMATLSDCVQAHQGVLVDYIGDELMAMWGAPEQQADHACLACQAALDMLKALLPLNERWQPVLGEPFSVGIGINTGVARVGNTGSNRKFKYGPLGNTVNLASRVQGASKYLRARLLVTGSTQARLPAHFACRRLCRVRVLNIVEPVDLYELVSADEPHWQALKAGYERALEAFESKELRASARLAGNLCVEHVGDGPSLVLLGRVVNLLVEERKDFDPIWDLPGK